MRLLQQNKLHNNSNNIHNTKSKTTTQSPILQTSHNERKQRNLESVNLVRPHEGWHFARVKNGMEADSNKPNKANENGKKLATTKSEDK